MLQERQARNFTQAFTGKPGRTHSSLNDSGGSNHFSIKDKVALITGATGYLGKSIAKGLAKSGALVYLNGRNEKKVNELIVELEKQDLKVRAAVFDVTNKDQIKSFFSNCSFKIWISFELFMQSEAISKIFN